MGLVDCPVYRRPCVCEGGGGGGLVDCPLDPRGGDGGGEVKGQAVPLRGVGPRHHLDRSRKSHGQAMDKHITASQGRMGHGRDYARLKVQAAVATVSLGLKFRQVRMKERKGTADRGGGAG